jgi:L-lysine exporter family protein LysE/ArgO
VSGSTALLAAASGMGLGFSLIVAIGAQNAFVLRQGLRGEHVAAVVTVCTLSDAVLIAAGVAGAGALLSGTPWLLTVVRIGGAAFLVVYGLLAARRALRRSTLQPTVAGPRAGVTSTVGTSLAMTWLNPHVYIDTLVLLGSIAATHGDARWWFAVGAETASAMWFPALGYGARLLRPVFGRPGAWRLLDGLIAAVMTVVAVSLLAR